MYWCCKFKEANPLIIGRYLSLSRKAKKDDKRTGGYFLFLNPENFLAESPSIWTRRKTSRDSILEEVLDHVTSSKAKSDACSAPFFRKDNWKYFRSSMVLTEYSSSFFLSGILSFIISRTNPPWLNHKSAGNPSLLRKHCRGHDDPLIPEGGLVPPGEHGPGQWQSSDGLPQQRVQWVVRLPSGTHRELLSLLLGHFDDLAAQQHYKARYAFTTFLLFCRCTT